MFFLALIFAIIIGYILKGRIKNIDASNIKGIYLVFISFFTEFIVVNLIRRGYLNRGTETFIIDLCMYALLFAFIYVNRKNKWIVTIGIGLILNALPIFLNGGAMPVSSSAIKSLGITDNVSKAGLYTIIDSNTKAAFLGDIFAMKYPYPGVASLGDAVAALGVMLFIITEMRPKKV